MMRTPIVLHGAIGESDWKIVMLKLQGNGVAFLVNVSDPGFGCIDGDGTVAFTFENGVKLASPNESEDNCTGAGALKITPFSGHKKLRVLLAEQRITALRVKSKNGVFERTVTPGTADTIRRIYNCFTRKPE